MVKNLKSLLIYGFIDWLIPFVIAIVIFPIHQSNRPFFDSIMPVVLAVTTVSLAVSLSRKQPLSHYQDGLKIGLIWMATNIILDQLFFTWGPMKMSFTDYWTNIGFTYLLIPTITVGMSLTHQNRAEG